MDLTEGTLQEKNNRAKKMMLWFGMASLFMSFAGWTSAVLIRSREKDWLSDLHFPTVFWYSLGVILISSLILLIAKNGLKNNNRNLTTSALIITFILGVVFVFMQFSGFQQLVDAGYYFTGPTSNPKSSFIFLLAFMHILHVVAGLICLLVVIYNHFKQKYSSKNLLGFELAATFWHYISLLWLGLFLFLNYYETIFS